MEVDSLLNKILQIEYGFQHIVDGADEVVSTHPKEECFELALTLFEHEAYQARMLATTVLGRLAIEDNNALCFLKERISTDKNWRVQEMFANTKDMKRPCCSLKNG